jgi:hypothetical protein
MTRKSIDVGIEQNVLRWRDAGVLDAESAERILQFERSGAQSVGIGWQVWLAVALGALMVAAGISLFVAAHWDVLSPAARFAITLALIAAFHLGAIAARARFERLSIALHAIGTVAAGAGIALAGQIFNIQEHWPTGILLTFLAAFVAWLLLGRDQIQATLCLLILPCWVLSEWEFYNADKTGSDVMLARILAMTAVLYLGAFAQSNRKLLQTILTIAAVPTLLIVAVILGEAPWAYSYHAERLSLSATLMGWLLVLLPLAAALIFRWRTMPLMLLALGWVLILPHTQTVQNGSEAWNRVGSGPLTFLVTAAFSTGVAWWGVRERSRLLVNLGAAGVGLTVLWFYFSNVFGKLQRSLALVIMGALFLLTGWAWEKVRQRLIAEIPNPDRSIA